MITSRRTFLGHLAAGTLLSAQMRRAAADRRIDRLGLQRYTVRTEMAKDFEGTIAKVAAAGYREVEFAGYFDQTPNSVRAILDRYKLTSPSTNIDYAVLEAKLPQVIEASHIVGHKFIVNPWNWISSG
jgi:sugar phosphate isomerase/epimerase